MLGSDRRQKYYDCGRLPDLLQRQRSNPVAITLLTAKIRCSLTGLPTLLLGRFEYLEIAVNNKERLRPRHLA